MFLKVRIRDGFRNNTHGVKGLLPVTSVKTYPVGLQKQLPNCQRTECLEPKRPLYNPHRSLIWVNEKIVLLN